MPSARYVPRPYVPEVYDSPNLVRLAELARASGYTQAERARTQGAQSAQGWARLGDLVVNALQGIQGDKAQKAALAQRASALAQQEQERQDANAIKLIELRDKANERAEQDRIRKEGETTKRAEGIVKQVGYGPIAEEQVDPLMASPETMGRVRYNFGPGTSEGPEITPNRSEQDMIDLRKTVGAQGGVVTPGGGVHMPPVPPKPSPVRVQPAMVNGKRVFVKVDDQGNMSDMMGQPIAAQPITPQSASGASPDGLGGIALSPDAIEEAAHRVRLFGPSSIPTRFNEGDKKRILNRSAEINKSIGQTPAAAAMRAAVQKADQVALNQISKQAASAESFENKALQQADLVKELSGKVDRTAYPIINGALVSGKAAMGDTNAHLLANALLTYTSEYAKIIEGSTGSASGSSDAARRAAAELISKALSKGTLKATVDQMNREMGMTRTGYRATIDDITGRMSGGGAPPSSAAIPPVVEEWVRDAKGNFVKKGGG